MSKPIFISYASDDTPAAITIRETIEAQGIACWMAPRDITPGQDYAEQIIDAIEAADLLLLILSEHANASIFVRHEVERAVSKGKIIVPVRIQPVQPSRSLEFFISTYQWVDVFDGPLAAQVPVVVDAISRHLDVQREQSGESDMSVSSAVADPGRSPTPHNLPHQLTPFIGRERELAALDELLAQPEVRLITILGPGGMGKTRLSLAVAEHYLSNPAFVDGIFFVALAPIRAHQHMLSALAAVLNLSLDSGDVRATQQQVLTYLRSRSMLLIFDNFEHLLDGADLIAQILQAAAQVRVLVTSRERLRVPGEHLYPIQGLDYGDGDTGQALQLFVQVARQIVPEYVIPLNERAHIAHICRLVGGMPLGIELAAAWLDVLSPAEIAAEIERSLDFLEAEPRGGVEHHGSLRAVFEASWQRLEPEEQVVFARLSIFRGGFTRIAAEKAADAAVGQLSALAGKSLIQHERGRGRYTLHELSRQFAEEKLHADQEAWTQAHDRHCTYYAMMLRQQEFRLKGTQYIAAIDEVEVEVENVRAAWTWAVTHARLEQIDHAMESLKHFYDTKTWYEEAESNLGRAVAMIERCEPADKHGILRGQLLVKQAAMWYQLAGTLNRPGAITKAQKLYRQSVELLQNDKQYGEDVVELGDAQTGLSVIAFHHGDDDLARQLANKAIELYKQLSDNWRLGNAYYRFGFRAMASGRYAEAKQFHQQGIACCRAADDHQGLGHNLNLLGEAHKALGELAEAYQAAQDALAVRSEANDQLGRAWSLQLLGDLSWRMGNLQKAKERSQASLTIFEDVGLEYGADFSLCNLGNIACTEGDYELALHYFRAVLTPKQARSEFDSDRVAEALHGMATVLIAEDKIAGAVELLLLTLQHPNGWQETKDRATVTLSHLSWDQRERPVRTLTTVVAELIEPPSNAKSHP